MKRATLAVVALVLLAGCTVNVSIGGQTTDPAPAQVRTATVVDVVDGDTLDVEYANGTEERVRLLGVDTPEVHVEVSPGEFEGVPDTEAGRSCLRKWGERASQFATERLAGETVTVVVGGDRRGSYGRLLAYVTVGANASGERSFNYALLNRGYARLYETEFARLDSFTAAENQAQANGTGLWACAS
ncbi:thermonuclease family protein [Halobacterium zhouii]|uniref:thermonuclease family protein n=1 Tax=Halobacterium zhouii TaxID=2902624 RepID=UPI001E64EF35|nr:thermonuclease family protein [Halobacterium zhouii]